MAMARFIAKVVTELINLSRRSSSGIDLSIATSCLTLGMLSGICAGATGICNGFICLFYVCVGQSVSSSDATSLNHDVVS